MSQPKTSQTKAFFKILNENLKFEDVHKISSAKVRRLFENESISPYLVDFVEGVTQENIVTRPQLQMYHLLLEQGKIKSGIELQKLLTKTEVENAAYDAHKTELDKRIDQASLKKKKLEYQLAQMEQIKQQQQQQLERLKALITDSTPLLRDKKNETERVDDQITKSITDFGTLFGNLCDVFENAGHHSYLLSQVELKNLLQAEERYNAQLTSFVKKQFSDVSQSLAADLNEPSSANEICHLNDENLLMEENEQTRKKIAVDIRRAENGYPGREKKLISALARKSSAQAVLSYLQEKQASATAEEGVSLADKLRHSLERTQHSSNEFRKETRQFSGEKIPALISSGTPLQTSHLLTGDYQIKLVRQEYLIEKQKKMILLLQQQQSRLDVIWVLLAVEEAGHEKAGKHIPVLFKQLESMLEKSIADAEWLKSNQEDKEDTTPRIVFDDKDKVALATYKILDMENAKGAGDSNLFRPFDDLPCTAEALKKRLEEVRNNVSSSVHPDNIILDALLRSTSICENLLKTSNYGDREDCTRVTLTPRSIEEMTNQLQHEFSRLSALVLGSSKEIEKKKNLEEYQHQRQTFVDRLKSNVTTS